ncbi:AAA domain-containing protein [Sphingopyxis indica]|uniref:AAA domain-containing protein n=2 Tax=Sphingopyxis indica TaxID=436663 RepID=A0A239E385_9SPHN|nr:AAA domain-containing protein [Sphingopyxis indica]
MALTRQDIVDALASERAINLQGAPFEVGTAEWEADLIILPVRPAKSRIKLPIDESIEGARIRWGADLVEGGLIKMVDPDKERLVVQILEGRMPTPGATAWVFQNDFLGPLIDMWNGPMAGLAAKRLQQSKDDVEPLQPVKLLPNDYHELRERQVLAVQSTVYRSSIMIGPPGTGKSYTIGAMTSYLLRRFSKGRILVVGPTNVAVDTAMPRALSAMLIAHSRLSVSGNEIAEQPCRPPCARRSVNRDVCAAACWMVARDVVITRAPAWQEEHQLSPNSAPNLLGRAKCGD